MKPSLTAAPNTPLAKPLAKPLDSFSVKRYLVRQQTYG